MFFKEYIKKKFFLIAILILYLISAFYNFNGSGIVSIDDGYYSIVGRTFSDIFKTSLTHPKEFFSSQYYVSLMQNYGSVFTGAQPFYILAAGFFGAIPGISHPIRLVGIVAGFLVVLFFYKILDIYQINRQIKIFSTILLVASPLFLFYSRLGASRIIGAFFIMASLFYILRCHQKYNRKYLIIAALLISLSAMSHYSLIPIALILVFYSLTVLYRNKAKFYDYFRFILIFFAPILIWEIITKVGVFMARTKNLGGLDNKIYSYFQEIADLLEKSNANQGFFWRDPLYYLRLFISSESLIIFVLGALGLYVIFKNTKYFRYNILLLLFLPFFINSSFLFIKVARQIIVLLPLFYLLASLALWQIYSWLSKRINKMTIYFLFAGFIIAIVILNFGTYNFIFNSKTNMPKAADFIVSSFNSKNTVVYSSAASIWRNYLPSFEVEPLGNMEKDLAREKSDKTILVISDRYTIGKNETGYFENYPYEIIGKFPAVASVSAPDKIKPFFKDEMPSNSEIVIHRVLIDTN